MIEVNNLTAKPVRKEFIVKLAEDVLRGEKKKEKNLSIALVGQERIKKLNKRYRGKNRATDVLAFSEKEIPNSSPPHQNLVRGQEFQIPKSLSGLGEIVVCLREVDKNAEIFNSTFKRELAKVLIHGILHLLGYEHEKGERGAGKMEKRQNYYLELVLKTETK